MMQCMCESISPYVMLMHCKLALAIFEDVVATDRNAADRKDGKQSVKFRQCWRIAWNELAARIPSLHNADVKYNSDATAALIKKHFSDFSQAQLETQDSKKKHHSVDTAVQTALGHDEELEDLRRENAILDKALEKSRGLYQELLQKDLERKFFAGKQGATGTNMSRNNQQRLRGKQICLVDSSSSCSTTP